MKTKLFLGIVFAVFILSFVFASYDFDGSSIQSEYQAGSFISGKLKMSFDNEFVNGSFTDSFGNKVSLKDLLLNSENSYSCEYDNCDSEFGLGTYGNNFNFNLNKGDDAFYGLSFDVDLTGINSVGFTFDSNAGEYNESQLAIDFFDDGVSDIESFDIGNSLNPDNFGCFNSSSSYTEITLSSSPYCQEIELSKSPGLKLGAWIKENEFDANSELYLKLYDAEGNYLNKCSPSISDVKSSGSRVYCDVDQPIFEEGNYYVCLSSNGKGSYRTRGYSQSGNCGFQGLPSSSSKKVYTYEIGAVEKYFGAVSETTVSNTLGMGEDLSDLIENYITSKYGSLDCSSDGCMVPIKVSSSVNQVVTLKNFEISYNFVGGDATVDGFYKFDEIPSRVNMSIQNLSLGNFFKIPLELGDLVYTLNYNGNEILEKEISVKDFDLVVSPDKISYGFPFEFTASYPSSLEADYFSWDFGDGFFETTVEPSVIHAYNDSGNYTMTLTISTDIGDVSDLFNIEVGSPKEVLDSKISERKVWLDNIENSLLSFSAFERAQVESFVDFDLLRSNLSQFEEEAVGATSDEDYHHIITEFLELSFPEFVEKSFAESSFFVSNSDNVDLDAVEEVSGQKYNKTDEAYEYVKFWEISNINSDFSQDKILVNWENGSVSTLNVFDFSLDFIGDSDEDYYLFVKNVPGLEVDTNNAVKEVDGYKYFVSPQGDFTFFVSSSAHPEDFLFISPKNIEVTSELNVSEAKTNYWLFVIGFFFVGLVAFGIYFFMHRWYDRKYESYLFPDKNQLYNAMIYVVNLSREGADESEIRKNLVDAGWKREQITYLLKKYAGKRTGMVDLFGLSKDKASIKRVAPKPGGNASFNSGKYPNFNK